MAPDPKLLRGRNIGMDFAGKDGWNMYHGDKVPGFPQHPHRGFETITIARRGFIDHSDSLGAAARFGEGDVQWMTAGGGILHDEFHSQNFTERGGVMEMAQLWVNLPAEHKMVEPGYQAIKASDIPTASLDGGDLRLIAGQYQGMEGPAETYSPLNVWDLSMTTNNQQTLSMPAGWNTIVVVLKGAVNINQRSVEVNDTVIFDPEHTELLIEAEADSTLLVLSGEPLNEPVVGAGPFVMNSQEEIMQAFDDFKRGKFGESLN